MAKKSSGGGKTPAGSRSAVSGRYVTPGYAKSHPSTTVTESRPKGSPPGTKGSSSKKK